MDQYHSIRDWMSSHDTHSHGISYESIDLEDEETYPLEGLMDAESADDMIDDARDLADIFVGHPSEYEACACAMIFGKCRGAQSHWEGSPADRGGDRERQKAPVGSVCGIRPGISGAGRVPCAGITFF